jgi:integrase
MDSDLSGFGLDVGKSGSKLFICRYRPKGTGRGGPRRFIAIGRFGVLTPSEARTEARRLLGLVAAGEDPAASAAEAKSAITFGELAERFIEDEIAPKRTPGTLRQYGQYLKHTLPEIGTLKAEKVSRASIAKLHLKIGKRHPVTANRTLTMLSTLFAFGVARGFLPDGMVNPARGISKFGEEPRERFLSAEEFERLGAALREAETTGTPWTVDESGPNTKHAPRPEKRLTVMSPFATAAIRLLIFTGCRLRGDFGPRMAVRRFRAGFAEPAALEDGQEDRRPRRPCPRHSRRPAPRRRLRHRRRRRGAAAVGPQAAVGRGVPSLRASGA